MTSPRWSRREFLTASLATTGWLASAACVAPFRPREQPLPAQPRISFAWGVASADPQPDAVLLWTRAAPLDGASRAVALVAQVATDPDFAQVLLEEPLRAEAERDHTVRLLVHELEPDREYHYRFVADGDASEVGRTRTAPLPDADRRVRFAFVSCQSYEQGFYGAWRRMLREDQAAHPAEQLDFVLNLGDFIYETVIPRDAAHLFDRAGRRRTIPRLPSEDVEPQGGLEARTLADYRLLYRTYLSDPDLREARARWPFVSIWDDHEFANDARRSHVPGGTHGEQDDPERRLAASRAWFEYVPALLSGAAGVPGVASSARDLVVPSPTEERPLDEERAIGAMTLYRSLRFGRNVELVVTDTRSYRSDHAIPAELARELGLAGQRLQPVGLVHTLDAGRSYDGGRPPASLSIDGRQFPNPRRDAPPGTILGPAQKSWWEATLAATDATWKLWANSVPCSPLRLDLERHGADARGLMLTGDAWDGYATERGELLHFIAREAIPNVVSLTADHHMHFCGLLLTDYDGPGQPVGVEFGVTALSSTSGFRGLLAVSRQDPELRAVTTFADPRFGPRVELLNLTFMDGVAAARALSSGSEIDVVLRLADPDHNRHLRYVDSGTNGYGLVSVDGERLAVDLVTVPTPLDDTGLEGLPIVRHARFELPAAPAVGEAQLAGPRFAGRPPFPWDGIRRQRRDPSR